MARAFRGGGRRSDSAFHSTEFKSPFGGYRLGRVRSVATSWASGVGCSTDGRAKLRGITRIVERGRALRLSPFPALKPDMRICRGHSDRVDVRLTAGAGRLSRGQPRAEFPEHVSKGKDPRAAPAMLAAPSLRGALATKQSRGGGTCGARGPQTAVLWPLDCFVASLLAMTSR